MKKQTNHLRADTARRAEKILQPDLLDLLASENIVPIDKNELALLDRIAASARDVVHRPTSVECRQLLDLALADLDRHQQTTGGVLTSDV